jgi:hypothetical protein
MVKVGKINLTSEQKKRTFHLPVEQVVIVPSTSGAKSQKKLTKADLNTRVNNVRRFMSKRFGGYTSAKATGGFVLRDGKLVKERVVKVTSFATQQDYKKHGSEVISQVGRWGRKWKQESVSYENEGDLFIIEPSKKGSLKVMKKVVGKKMIKVKIPTRKKRKATPQQLKNLAKARRMRGR